MQKIASLPVLFPMVKRGLALAARTLPVAFIKDPTAPFQDWFSKNDIGSIDDAQLPLAEECIESMVSHAANKIESAHNQAMFIARGETRVVRLLCKKKHKGFPVFEKFEDILEEQKLEIAEFLQSGRVKARSNAERLAAEQSDKVWM
jgi:hypothetical protein